ncbi:ras-related protein Rap-1A [Hydra vulgaris]|uniref:ras-related protein Rap-1A n=1 Tax=Hydra vulgaris TaxID=6087 RepID=UPI000640C997|nr:ras-related protein Rap-1A [Hydra vulgaris]
MEHGKRRRNAIRVSTQKDVILLMLLGKSKVGKTSLVNRWLKDTFTDTYTPTVENFHLKSYNHQNQFINLGIIDLTGSWDFPAMQNLYLSKADSVMFVYEIGNESSIKEMKLLYERFLKVKTSDREVTVSVVGTKYDTTIEGDSNFDDKSNKCAYLCHQSLVCEIGNSHQNVAYSPSIDTDAETIVLENQNLTCDSFKVSLTGFLSDIKEKCTHIVTSSKLNINVHLAFENALNGLVESLPPSSQDMQILVQKLSKSKYKNLVSWCCCLRFSKF